ncbi:MAG: hypothetical protein IPJ65_12965 [Archangiaceae bacterium]|nr:hypothetical protein [Archangiaceae bacterium]
MRPLLPLGFAVGLVVSCGTGETPESPKVRTTYRVLSGVSMGATGAAALGFTHPEKFDAVAVLGGPLDGAYFGRMVDRFMTGGFCPRADLEAILARDPARLNDPVEIAKCEKPEPAIGWEHAQSFNRWHFSTNGTQTHRDTYLDMFTDITLAYGNFGTENPESAFAPPGVPVEHVRHPPADFCTHPVRVKQLYNLEYNPEGKYDAVTFCDGEPTLYRCSGSGERVDFCSEPANVLQPLPRAMEAAFAAAYCAAKGGVHEANKNDDLEFMYANAGAVDPCREATRPFTLALAYDYNGNGRRDYGEPLVKNARERFDDTGVDGCADAKEDGKGGCTATGASGDPNHDDYDPDSNPRGTENDWLREEGEAYRDDGLDGVAGTHDVGEGNGAYDLASGLKKFLQYDGRSNLRQLTPASRARVSVLVDGGIRDVFNLGLMSKHFFSLLKSLRGETAVGEYRDFLEIPGMKDRRSGTYNPWNALWPVKVPRDVAVFYGKEHPTTAELLDGEGDHVGTAGEAVNRFYTLFNWAAASWPGLDRPATPLGGATASERQRIESFDSQALGAKWEYAISLPPGYDAAENAAARYPVVFMLHGYGMNPRDFMATSVLTDIFVTDTDVRLRPMIFVFPNGRCCWTNALTKARDCRETDETGKDIDQTAPGWARECQSGSFYVNRSGYDSGDGSRYGDALFELMEHIDQRYRTLETTDVTAR